jgi:hypothetical protein
MLTRRQSLTRQASLMGNAGGMDASPNLGNSAFMRTGSINMFGTFGSQMVN